MAVVENAVGSDIGLRADSSLRHELDAEHENNLSKSAALKKNHLGATGIPGSVPHLHHDSLSGIDKGFQPSQQWVGQTMVTQFPNGGQTLDKEGEFKRDMMDLQELLSKLNPMAEEFVPQSHANHVSSVFAGSSVGSELYSNNFIIPGAYHDGGFTKGGYLDIGNANGGRRRKNGHGQGRWRTNNRTSMAQQEEMIRRTVYVSDIDQQVTEEELASLFVHCGQVVDCRVCGDPNSVLRFAFVEFTDEEGANAALSLSKTMLGFYPVRVLPSKTAIAPVDPKFLPRSEDEREMCTRTIYCTNIDNKVKQSELKLFFEGVCGPVYRLRLLGDHHHATRIAFIEFARAESAILALNCSGAMLGSLPLRVSPSKTPVRPRVTRSYMP